MAGLATARIAKDQNERAIETLQLLAELQVTESAEKRAETKKKLEGKRKYEKSKTLRYRVIQDRVVQPKSSYIIMILQTNRRLHTLIKF